MVKKSDKDAVGPSRGWLKALNKTVMFVLLPLRKPAVVIPLLLALYLIPTFIGAKPTEVHLWYWHKLQKIYGSISNSVGNTAGKYLENLSLPDFSSRPVPEPAPIERVVTVPENTPQEIRRQMFEKAKGETKAIDILQQPQPEPEVRPQAVTPTPAPKTTVPVVIPATKAQRQKSLDLIYLPETQELTGIAHVVNANELEIKGTHLFLYGVYVNPRTAQGFNAASFLKDLTAGRVVKCLIDAYTSQGVPTGICYVGSSNLKKALVEEGLSADVAL